jgi:hypothetical protein
MQDQPQPDHERQHGGDNEDKTDCVFGRKPSVKQITSDTPKKGYFSKFKNWVNLFTLLFVATYTCLTYCALRVSEDVALSTKDSADAAVVGAQPAVFVRQVLLNDISYLDKTVDSLPVEADKESKICIEFSNVGKSPAIVTRYAINWDESPELPPVPPEPKNIRVYDTDIPTEGRRPICEPVQKILLTKDRIAAINEGRSNLWVYGFVDFTDILEWKHTVRFATIWTKSGFARGGPEAYNKSLKHREDHE